jgi:secreted Zn-dependent insulinase-like peptidase
LLKQWENTDLWYKKDDKFLRPKAEVNLKLYTSDCDFGSSTEGRLFANVW